MTFWHINARKGDAALGWTFALLGVCLFLPPPATQFTQSCGRLSEDDPYNPPNKNTKRAVSATFYIPLPTNRRRTQKQLQSIQVLWYPLTNHNNRSPSPFLASARA